MKFKNKELEVVLKAIDKAVLKNVIVYDISSVTPFFDYSIITSASSSRQGHAAVDYLRDIAEENGILVKGYADSSDSSWFLVDLNNLLRS